MKNVFVMAIVFACTAVAEEAHVEKAPVVTEVIEGAKVYGENWTASADSISIDEALKAGVSDTEKAKIFTGRVTKVCQKAGCWMILENKGEFARVDFNDHSFFIPKDSSGAAEVYGVLKAQVMSDEQREHLKEDGAGDMPEKVYEIIATSVKIGP